MTGLLLLRHGQTGLNVEGRFRGHLDPPLDSGGVEQAEAAARRIGPFDPAAVYASPLRRTAETARVIADRFGLEVVEVPGLIDLDYGAWEGLTWDEAMAADPKAVAVFRSDPHAAIPPGGEPVISVQSRVMRTLEELVSRAPGASLVAVTHEIPIRLVLASLLGWGGGDMWRLDIPPGSIARLESDQGRLSVVELPDAD